MTISAKPVGVAAVSQVWITKADNFGLWPQSERMPDALLCAPHEKLTAFLEIEAAIRNVGVHSKPKNTTPTAKRNPLGSWISRFPEK